MVFHIVCHRLEFHLSRLSGGNKIDCDLWSTFYQHARLKAGPVPNIEGAGLIFFFFYKYQRNEHWNRLLCFCFQLLGIPWGQKLKRLITKWTAVEYAIVYYMYWCSHLIIDIYARNERVSIVSFFRSWRSSRTYMKDDPKHTRDEKSAFWLDETGQNVQVFEQVLFFFKATYNIKTEEEKTTNNSTYLVSVRLHEGWFETQTKGGCASM